MKVLVDATFLVYLSEGGIGFLEKLDVSTTSSVLKEVSYILPTHIANQMLLSLNEAKAVKPKTGSMGSRWLSQTDLELLNSAKEGNYLLVTDDKKLTGQARLEKVKVIDTPHFLESKAELLGKEEVIIFLELLQQFYLRKSLIAGVLGRLKKR